jgi:hypothetical protein
MAGAGGVPHTTEIMSRVRSILHGAAIALVGGACGSPSSEIVGAEREAIIGGTTDPGDPAVVMVLGAVPTSVGGTGTAYQGTGSVISPHVVLTAAHLFTKVLSDPHASSAVFYVFTASDQTAQGGQHTNPLSAREVHVDPAYNPTYPASGHDFAVMILDSPTAIPPLPLNRAPVDSSWVGKPMRFVGYGVTSSGDVTGASANIRREGTSRIGNIDSLFLISAPGGASQPCYGDSGGPALVTIGGVEMLAGVLSYGDQSCLAGEFGRVDNVLPFIDRWIANFDPGFDAGVALDASKDAVPDAPGLMDDAAIADDVAQSPSPDSPDGGGVETGVGEQNPAIGEPTTTSSGCSIPGGMQRRPGLLVVAIALVVGAFFRRRAERPYGRSN